MSAATTPPPLERAEPSPPPLSRWYGPFLAPVLPTVRAAVGESARTDRLPRWGLGGAVVVHLARGYGARRSREAIRLGILALEAYNQRAFGGEDDEGRGVWLSHDLGRVRRVWRGILRRDERTLQRVIDRLSSGPPAIADETVPEGVIFFRLAVAAGALAGDLQDDLHAALDRVATDLGLAWEAAQRTLSEDGVRGALLAIGADPPRALGDPERFAAARARAALDALPDGAPRDALALLLDRPMAEGRTDRVATAHRPWLAPLPAPRDRAEAAGGAGPLGLFARQVLPSVEAALARTVASESICLQRATTYLRGQGGKRVRSVMVVAAAAACARPYDRAMDAAALVEWLHQASLVLDDMVDEASVRRGGPTLHAATSGPFSLVVAAFLLSRIHTGARSLPPRAREALLDTTGALLDGQRLELRHTGDATLGATRYYKIIEAKTARLFSLAAALGGHAALATKGQVRALSRYGHDAGLAFQIVDDLLDYVGDERVLGKTPGTDLRARKMTLPLLVLRDTAGAEATDALVRTGELPAIRAAMSAHDVPATCLGFARRHLEAAERALAPLPGAAGKAVLLDLARAMVERER